MGHVAYHPARTGVSNNHKVQVTGENLFSLYQKLGHSYVVYRQYFNLLAF